ncbi:hypothetical protein BGZ54_003432, partial [Gamsiella multidivaricata]
KYNLTGKGVKIGVIDTGIDYKHPAFAAAGADAGCFALNGKNCRVRYGWDFVGDDYTGSNAPNPDSDPMDCLGHGSHVAGIIGGNALNIKVSPEPPQPFVGVSLDARAKLVINMSIAGGSSYKTNPISVLAEKFLIRGKALVGPAGNDGSDGVGMVSGTGLGDHATSVASFDNQSGLFYYLTYGGKDFPYNFSEAYGETINLPASATIVPLLFNGKLSDGCNQSLYNGVDVEGKIVLVLGDITRCKSGGRGALAVTNGAAGMIIQSSGAGIDSLGGVPNLPMASIEFDAGIQLLDTWMANPESVMTWSNVQGPFSIDNWGAPSSFSSFGLDGDLRSKPDVAAPGGNILSTYPLALGGYAVLSGTSMATSYVSGAHALYMQAKKVKSHGDRIRKIFKNTATISKNYKSETFTSAAKQGAGLINVLNAVLASTEFCPDHIDLLDTVNFRRRVKVQINNTGKNAETYTLTHVPADALNSYNANNAFPLGTPIIESDYATIKFDPCTVTINPGESAKVTLKFTEPKRGKAADWPLYSGFVVATPRSEGGVAVHIPYTGIKGDIRDMPIQDTSLGFPKLKRLDISTGQPVERHLDRDDKPVILSRFGSHSPDATIRIYDGFAGGDFIGFLTSKDGGPAFGAAGRTKNVDSTTGQLAFTQYTWEGLVLPAENTTLAPIRLPISPENSTSPFHYYRIVVASQKKLTKGNYLEDFEIFDLGPVRLARSILNP